MKIDLSNPDVILGDFVEVDYTKVDFELYSQVTDYKARIASKFKSTSPAHIDNLQGNEFYISLKLDGEHAHLYYDEDEDDQVFLIRPRGYAYAGLPILKRARDILKKAGIKRCLLPGELYVKKTDNTRSRIFDVIHITKSPKSEADLETLYFAPFDILILDDEIFVDYRDVVARLKERLGDTDLAPPPTIISNSRDDIHRQYDQWVNQEGAEGLMIRSDLTFRYKLKAEHTVDAVIIGYTHEDEKVTSVLTGLVTEEGHIQVLAPVEKGFTDVDLIGLYQKLSKMHAESDYMEVSRFHTPFYMVMPRVIIEFSANDMVAERANGQPIKNAVLKLKDSRYRLLKSSPLVSMKHCVFQRFRDDKEVNPVDLRMRQITDYVFIDLEENTPEIEFPSTEIVAREVFVKESRGKVSLRKLVAWKTNKERIDDNYTAYVFNYTDYSPGRQEPLKQDVRISQSKIQILDIYKEFKEKNIKSGWKNIAHENRQADLTE